MESIYVYLIGWNFFGSLRSVIANIANSCEKDVPGSYSVVTIAVVPPGAYRACLAPRLYEWNYSLLGIYSQTLLCYGVDEGGCFSPPYMLVYRCWLHRGSCVLSFLVSYAKPAFSYIIATCWTASRTSFVNFWVCTATQNNGDCNTVAFYKHHSRGWCQKLFLKTYFLYFLERKRERERERERWINQLTNVRFTL